MSSLFASPYTVVKSEFTGQQALRESSHGGVPERIGAQKNLVLSGFEPRPPALQASALSVVLCPSGISKKKIIFLSLREIDSFDAP